MYSYNEMMPSRIWGPLIVLGIYTLAGALVGLAMAMWPGGDTSALTAPLAIGTLAGFVVGILIVWFVRESEGVTLTSGPGYR